VEAVYVNKIKYHFHHTLKIRYSFLAFSQYHLIVVVFVGFADVLSSLQS